jgi:hypothetical protein
MQWLETGETLNDPRDENFAGFNLALVQETCSQVESIEGDWVVGEELTKGEYRTTELKFLPQGMIFVASILEVCAPGMSSKDAAVHVLVVTITWLVMFTFNLFLSVWLSSS